MAVAVERGTILELAERVNSLSGQDHEVFGNLMRVYVGVSQLKSDSLALGGLGYQTIIKIHNRWEHIVDKLNATRAFRPQGTVSLADLEEEIKREKGKDPFCPENLDTKTPEHSFGRIRGKYYISAANLYPAGPFHGVIIPPDHNPLVEPTRAQFSDALYVTDGFAEAAHGTDGNFIYTSLIQNNLHRAGASIWQHSHMHVQQEFGCHEGIMEELLDISHRYRWQFGRDYFQDLFRAHQAVGLGVEKDGVMVIPSLTALKERNIRMIAYSFDEPQREVVFEIYRYFMAADGFNEKAFNFAIYYRPISYDGRDWGGFPAIVVEMISRGDVGKTNNDIGASEYLSRSPFIATDPYRVHDGIREALAA